MSGSKPIYKDLKNTPAKLPPVMESPESSIIADKNLIDLALDTLQDIFFVFDVEGRLLHWNQRLAEITGYAADEIARMHPLDFFVGENVRLIEDGILKTLANGSNRVEAELTTKHGDRIPYEFRGSRLTDSDGKVIGICGSGRDISDRKEAEVELRKERNFAESLIEAANVIVLVLDLRGRIMRFNSYMEELSGYRLQEVRGKDWFDTFLPQRDRPQIRGLFSRAVDNVQTSGNVNPIVTKDGLEREIEWYDNTLKDADGNAVGLLALGQDITERKRDEELLRKRREELVELSRRLEDTNRGLLALHLEMDQRARELQRIADWRSNVLREISHEFRNPLGTVTNLSWILLSGADGELTAAQQRDITLIRNTARSLADLTHDLLDTARIEAGKIPVRASEFRVADLFSSLRGMMRPLVVNPEVELVFEEPLDFPTLHTDEGKVTQVLRNLISNGLKFTERGEIRVLAKLDDAGEVAVFSVSDTGIGIAPEDHERIFEEFVQLMSPLQRRAKGMGLGLSISRGLTQLLGGSLTVESELGAGSTFTATIPLVYQGEATEEVNND